MLTPSTFCFSVHAAAEPCVLSRVLDVFSLFGSTPDTCHSHRGGPDRSELVIDVQMLDLDRETAALVAKRLGRIVHVEQVLWSEKRRVAA